MHLVRAVRPEFEHGSLEILADHAWSGALKIEDGAGRIVRAGLGLGVAEGLQASQGVKKVQEADRRAVDGDVGHAVAPRPQRQAWLLAQQVRLPA